MHNITTSMPISQVKAATAAGTGDTLTTTAVDMRDAQSVAFITTFPAITSGAVTTFKLQAGNESDGSDAADITGATISVADDDDGETFVLECYRPVGARYVRAAIVRATQNASVGAIYAIQGGYKYPKTGLNDVTDTITTDLTVEPVIS